jgi:hypothetical protein
MVPREGGQLQTSYGRRCVLTIQKRKPFSSRVGANRSNLSETKSEALRLTVDVKNDLGRQRVQQNRLCHHYVQHAEESKFPPKGPVKWWEPGIRIQKAQGTGAYGPGLQWGPRTERAGANMSKKQNGTR